MGKVARGQRSLFSMSNGPRSKFVLSFFSGLNKVVIDNVIFLYMDVFLSQRLSVYFVDEKNIFCSPNTARWLAEKRISSRLFVYCQTLKQVPHCAFVGKLCAQSTVNRASTVGTR